MKSTSKSDHHEGLRKDQFFAGRNRRVPARAPGRLDVMGGVADYSGSLLLQMPIREVTTVTVAERKDGRLRVYSCTAQEQGLPAEVTIPLSIFFQGDELVQSYGIDRSRLIEKETGACMYWAVSMN